VKLRSASAVGIALVVLGACAGSGTAPPHPRLDVRRVYMGVSCPEANSIRCDRVGLAVWLRGRVEQLEASIAGRPLALHRRGDHFEGFLRPAGLIDGPLRVHPDGGRYRWTGRVPVSGRVRLIARYRGGKAKRRTLSVPLAAGWG
jgi:hypothetical protein